MTLSFLTLEKATSESVPHGKQKWDFMEKSTGAVEYYPECTQ
jgi:hypothetical protein